jgi:putative transposase
MMNSLTLTLSERRALEQKIQQTKDVKVLKRAQALLWLNQGMPVQEILRRLGVSRRTVYAWVSLYRKRRNRSIVDRLQDQPKSGRPSIKAILVMKVLPQLLEESPSQYGYNRANWTSTLLQRVLQCQYGANVSTRTIRRCLKNLDYVWRRPTYALLRQSPTWRQEKGGSKKVSARTESL